jgi:hypothetical protein
VLVAGPDGDGAELVSRLLDAVDAVAPRR